MSDNDLDSQRAAALQAAVLAAIRANTNLYATIAEHWLMLDTTARVLAAIAAIEARGFLVAAAAKTSLLNAAHAAAKTDFWRRHRIIDALDSDIHEAAFRGASTALEDYHPTTAEEVSKYEREAFEGLAQRLKV